MLSMVRMRNFLPPPRWYHALMEQNAHSRQQPRLVRTLAMGLSKYLWKTVRFGNGSASRSAGLPERRDDRPPVAVAVAEARDA